MYAQTKIALCVAIALGTPSAAMAKSNHHKHRQSAAVVEMADGTSAYGQGLSRFSHAGSCWVPARDSDPAYGEDPRGFGYWGSCSARGARPMK